MRNTTPYTSLVEQIMDTGFDGELVTQEVGSRGFLEIFHPTILQQQLLQCTKKPWRMLLDTVSQAVIKDSHKIWVMRNGQNPHCSMYLCIAYKQYNNHYNNYTYH